MDIEGKKFGMIIANRTFEPHERKQVFELFGRLNAQNEEKGTKLPQICCEFIVRDKEEVLYLFDKWFKEWYATSNVDEKSVCEKEEVRHINAVPVVAPIAPAVTNSKAEDVRSVEESPAAVQHRTEKQVVPPLKPTSSLLCKRPHPEEPTTATISKFGVVKRVKVLTQDEPSTSEDRPTDSLVSDAPSERPLDESSTTASTTNTTIASTTNNTEDPALDSPLYCSPPYDSPSYDIPVFDFENDPSQGTCDPEPEHHCVVGGDEDDLGFLDEIIESGNYSSDCESDG